MNILVVDDNDLVTTLLDVFLSGVGHSVSVFTDPSEALQHVGPQTDLVISDVDMPLINGFQFADEVARQRGTTPPMTLLISGKYHQSWLDSVTPTRVIGLVPKPFELPKFAEIISLLGDSRDTCPGMLPSLRERTNCPYRAGRQICEQQTYSQCEYYHQTGLELRRWIAQTCSVESLRSARD